MSLKIYGVLKSRASRNVWLLNDLDKPYELVPIVQTYRLKDPNAADAPVHTQSAEFRRINPNGHIPTLTDGALTLHESLAINLYIAKKFGGPLAPKDVAEDGEMTMWALWAATEVETHSLNLLMHTAQLPEAERDPAVAAAAREGLQQPLAVLSNALTTGGGFLVGRRFTVADINTCEVCRYAQRSSDVIDAFPAVKTWMEACQARPAFAKMWADRAAEPDPA
ncbi:MAG TPA: glutathione S-transferase family protein [Rhizomicrobium sp.]|nr:glutathione S-transferase family protein [Rhizomicrobium sp.]